MDLSCFLDRGNFFGELLQYSFSRSKYKRRYKDNVIDRKIDVTAIQFLLV